ncbi:SRPBCC family protein, partial [Nocardia niigatensis]
MSKALRDKTDGVGKVAADTVGRVAKTATRAGETAQQTVRSSAPTDLLQQSVQNLAGTLGERAVAGLSNRVSRTAERLNDYADGRGGSLLAAVTGVEKLAGGASPLQAVMSAGTSKLGH